jgi:hypothetical protein
VIARERRSALRSLALLHAALLFAAPRAARAADTADTAAPPPTEPSAAAWDASLLWAAAQLVPSPEAVVWNGAARLGLRWQVTPLLYSFGLNRKLTPFRSFLVEPIARHSGSIELHVSPELLAGPLAAGTERWLLRVGLRSYFPLLYRGDYLSASVGGALLHAGALNGASFDAGIHALGGFVGLRASYCPTPGLRVLTVGLEIRIF